MNIKNHKYFEQAFKMDRFGATKMNNQMDENEVLFSFLTPTLNPLPF